LTGREITPISELARNPLRVEQRPRTGADGAVGSVRFPVWFEPTGDGKTPMAGAFQRAGALVAGFLADHPDCFPPVVINITDGKPTDANPEQDASRLRQLSSTDGNVLVFNLHISDSSGQRIEFPDREDVLPDLYSRLLFRMSSPLPLPMWDAARESGIQVTAATRGFVFNADIDSVIRSLDIGTRVGVANKK
jgi:hypothetical protein